MDEVQERANQLRSDITKATERLKVVELDNQLTKLQAESKALEFWKDNRSAQDTMIKIASLESRVNPWKKLVKDLDDINEWIEIDDEADSADLLEQLGEVETGFNSLKKDLRFSGPYDDRDVVLSIYAGAGGTDAQDWAQMLLRMYVRWAEKHKYSVSVIDESPGEEAGLKSVTIEVIGDYLYGKLKGENGVHRLVRLSPFNSDNLRQTSFAKVEVLPKIDKPGDLEINESDLKVDVFRSGGHGGQSVNTTDSAVRVTHLPTGIVVSIQNERSQTQNKELALSVLYSRLVQLQLEQHQNSVDNLKGPNQSAEWGNQIRSYVLHPYKQVKDLRTKFEVKDPGSVLDGEVDVFLEAYIEQNSET